MKLLCKFLTDYLLSVRAKIVLYSNLSQYGKDCVLPNFARIFVLTNNGKISITYNAISALPIFSFWNPG